MKGRDPHPICSRQVNNIQMFHTDTKNMEVQDQICISRHTCNTKMYILAQNNNRLNKWTVGGLSMSKISWMGNSIQSMVWTLNLQEIWVQITHTHTYNNKMTITYSVYIELTKNSKRWKMRYKQLKWRRPTLNKY